MENVEQPKKKSEEIDLAEIFRSIVKGFTRVGDYFLYVIASLRNTIRDNKLVFLTCAIIGIGSVLCYRLLIEKTYYQSTMIVNCRFLSAQFIENTVDNLNMLADESDRISLAQHLKVTDDVASKIDEFSYEPFITEDDRIQMELLKEKMANSGIEDKELIQELFSELKYANRNTYRITASVYDPTVISSLEEAIVNYIKSNNYIKKRIEINTLNHQKRREKLVIESRKLDSLKNVLFENFQSLNKTSRGSNNVILGDERLTNPLDVFNHELNLHAAILEIDRELYINPDFEVIEGFITTTQPSNIPLAALLAIAIILSVLFGYVIIGMWKFNRVLDRYPTKEA